MAALRRPATDEPRLAQHGVEPVHVPGCHEQVEVAAGADRVTTQQQPADLRAAQRGNGRRNRRGQPFRVNSVPGQPGRGRSDRTDIGHEVRTSRPATIGLSTAVRPNVTVIGPVVVTGNSRTTAWFFPPDAAKMSKPVSCFVPLTSTSKSR